MGETRGTSRRRFLALSLAAVGGVFVPKYGHWYRKGSGLLVPERGLRRATIVAIDLSQSSFTLEWSPWDPSDYTFVSTKDQWARVLLP